MHTKTTLSTGATALPTRSTAANIIKPIREFISHDHSVLFQYSSSFKDFLLLTKNLQNIKELQIDVNLDDDISIVYFNYLEKLSKWCSKNDIEICTLTKGKKTEIWAVKDVKRVFGADMNLYTVKEVLDKIKYPIIRKMYLCIVQYLIRVGEGWDECIKGNTMYDWFDQVLYENKEMDQEDIDLEYIDQIEDMLKQYQYSSNSSKVLKEIRRVKLPKRYKLPRLRAGMQKDIVSLYEQLLPLLDHKKLLSEYIFVDEKTLHDGDFITYDQCMRFNWQLDQMCDEWYSQMNDRLGNYEVFFPKKYMKLDPTVTKLNFKKDQYLEDLTSFINNFTKFYERNI